jgi:mannose-6-phosphate isomerase-like protein (cupin superfamily)
MHTLPTAYRYVLPPSEGRVKDIVDIWQSEVLGVEVQVVRSGGETNLHAHNGLDSLWFVLSGTAAFYDESDREYILHRHESIALPKGTRYWFQSVGEEPLEVLHITGHDPAVGPTRVDLAPRPQRIGRGLRHKAETIQPVSR